MTKYFYEFKLEVVQYALLHHWGYKRTAKRFGISNEQVRRWLSNYNEFGEEGLRNSQSKKTYPFELKKKAVLAIIDDGLSLRESAQMLGLKSSALVANWLNQYRKNGIKGLKPKPKGCPKLMLKPRMPRTQYTQEDRDKTQEQLLEEVATLRAEVAFLKKRRALIQKQKEQEKAKQQ